MSNPDTGHNYLGVVADGQSRSRHLQRLIQRSKQNAIPDLGRSIPRSLVQYWDESEIPSDVQRCLNSWCVTDDLGLERLIYDQYKARAFVEHHFSDLHLRAFDSCTHPAMRSDYFRLCFLQQCGGLYVDADDELREPGAILPLMDSGILRLQPLCYQVSTDSMVVPDDFADEVSDDLVFYAANDPIFAPPNHPVIEAALIQATDRLIAAGGSSKDIQWLTGPGNLSEVLVRHSLHLEEAAERPDFAFISSWVQIAPGDWNLDYRNDARNWRLWLADGNRQ